MDANTARLINRIQSLQNADSALTDLEKLETIYELVQLFSDQETHVQVINHDLQQAYLMARLLARHPRDTIN